MDPTTVYTDFLNSISSQTDQSVVIRKLVFSVILLVLFWVANRMAVRYIRHRDLSARARFRWTKVASYTIGIFGFFTIGALWWEFIGSLATLLGLVLAGVAVALRDPLTNIAGWAYIVGRRPFVLGDRIEVDNVRGDVANITPFIFSLAEVGRDVGAEQPTGRLVHIPNNFVFIKPVANATLGFEYVWDEIPVVVTFESDWEKAKELIIDIVDRHTTDFAPEAMKQVDKATTKFRLAADTFDPKVFTNVVDIGVEISMRYIVEVRSRRAVRQTIWEDILRSFARAADLDFAYPTQRVYFNQQEGKPGTGGPPAPSSR